MDNVEVVLREATAADADAGAALHRNCWREAYGPLVDPGLLAARLADVMRWIQSWREALDAGEPRVLALVDGELIGFARAGTSRDPQPPTPDELYAVYVRQAWWGTGVGQALLECVLGQRSASVWVLENNARAIAFYARNGFAPDGARERYDALDAWEIRMVRP